MYKHEINLNTIIGASLSEPHLVSSTRALSVPCVYVKWKLNATQARSVQHHVQLDQFFQTVERFVVESSYRSKSVLARQDSICSVANREGLLGRDLHLSWPA